MSVRRRQDDLPGIRSLLAVNPEARLLDLGGGTGALAAVFAREVARVVVLEPNPRKVAFGRRRHAGVTFVEGSGESIPFPDGSFDRAIAMLSFHHVHDPDRVLEEVHRVLAPSGRFLLQEFHPAHAPGALARRVRGRRHGTHPHRYYEPAELRAALEAHGFRDASTHAARRGYLALAVR